MLWLGELGAGLLAAFGTLALLVTACWLAQKTLDRLYPEPRDPYAPARKHRGKIFTVLSVIYLLVLGILFYPSIEALNRFSCSRADNVEDCMTGGGRG